MFLPTWLSSGFLHNLYFRFLGMMAPVSGMDFARNQLLKYGWKEGKGLGKHESGITKAIKPKLKFDTRGVGHDASEEFTYNWWENAYNKAADNVHISTTENGIAVELKDESIDITTKKYSLKKLKKKNPLEYGTFLKTSTLTQGGQMIRIRPEVSEVIELEGSVGACENLTDEDLFRICGGRTAHKGARHGLKLSGKLARIEEQEKKFLAHRKDEKSKPVQNLYCEQIQELQMVDETKTRMKKRKRKSERRDGEICVDEHFQQLNNENITLDDAGKILDENSVKCKKVQKLLHIEENQELSRDHISSEIQKKKKKIKKSNWTEEDEYFFNRGGQNAESGEKYLDISSLDTEISNGKSSKNKKKKRKKSRLEEHSETEEYNSISGNDTIVTEKINPKMKRRKSLKTVDL